MQDLNENPGERDLRRCGLLALRNICEHFHEHRISTLRCSGFRSSGTVLRKSLLLKAVFSSILPVKNALPEG